MSLGHDDWNRLKKEKKKRNGPMDFFLWTLTQPFCGQFCKIIPPKPNTGSKDRADVERRDR